MSIAVPKEATSLVLSMPYLGAVAGIFLHSIPNHQPLQPMASRKTCCEIHGDEVHKAVAMRCVGQQQRGVQGDNDKAHRATTMGHMGDTDEMHGATPTKRTATTMRCTATTMRCTATTTGHMG